MKCFVRVVCVAAVCVWAVAALGQTDAANWPVKEGTYTIDHFRFKDGEAIEHLRLHYLTLGEPHRDAAGHVDNAVLLLHGTGGDAHTLLNPVFSNVLFVPGGVLDIAKYSLILPDDIGQGESSKPSDGLHARFPQYDYCAAPRPRANHVIASV
jgi:homoserine O-acetyltransferase